MVGSATSLVGVTVLLVVGALCWKKYGKKRTKEEQDTYVEYKDEINEMEREETRQETEDLNKLKDEIDVIKTINNIVTLTGEEMNEMVRSLESMCATMENTEAPMEMDKASSWLPETIRPFRGRQVEEVNGEDFKEAH